MHSSSHSFHAQFQFPLNSCISNFELIMMSLLMPLAWMYFVSILVQSQLPPLLYLCIMSDPPPAQEMPLMCGGIQHSKITQFAKDTANLQVFHERWHYIRGEWYSKYCSFIATAAGSKSAPRCTKCSIIHLNIQAK